MYRYNKTQKKWQKHYIKNVFEKYKSDNQSGFTNRILSDLDLLNSKSRHMPKNLYKFYPVTSENILDIKNKKLWLSHPSTFNDPFDCKIGYNKFEYQKKELIDLIRKEGLIKEGLDGFTNDEVNNIVNSYVDGEENNYFYTKYENFAWLMYKILNDKSDKFREYINKFLREKNTEVENKMGKIRDTNIRVACFTEFKDDDYVMDKSQMWSHYADNHKGFCVKYDMNPLLKDITFFFDILQFYKKGKEYLEERLAATIKGGLFPVIYTSNRVKLPYTKLKKLDPNDYKSVEELLYKAYITKSTIWSYENEWRLIVDDEISEYFENKISFPFIKCIFLGCRMDEKYKKLCFLQVLFGESCK